MSAPSKPEVILIKETLIVSLARDAGTLAMIVSMIGIGVFLESAAMQWVGAIMAFVTIATLDSGTRKRCTMSVSEARRRLDEIERGDA